MPELPEVEHIARCLRTGGRGESGLIGERIEALVILCPKLTLGGRTDLGARLVSAPIHDVDRRGKYLRLRCTGADVVIHLRMTGDLLVVSEAAGDEPRHIRLRFDLSSRRSLVLDDPRRLAEAWIVDEGTWPRDDIAPDPLDPTWSAVELHRRLARGRRPLKAALLDQTLLSGLGNIWVDETLQRARLHPARTAGSLTLDEAGRVLVSARFVLRGAIDALEHEGLTWAYRSGRRGPLPGRVHGRAGGLCPDCEQLLVNLRLGGRTTTLCPACQPLP